MTVLSPSPRPSALLTSTSNSNILSILSPALTQSLYLAAVFQRLLSTTTLFVAIRAYFISLILLRQSFYASQILLLQSYWATILLSRRSLAAVKSVVKMSWKATESIRRKLFFEFMVFILGGGYGLCLILLWPGWLVIGGTWMLYRVCS